MLLVRIIQIYVIVCLAVVSTGVLAKLDCDKTKHDQARLQQAVDKANPGETILVKGTCNGISLGACWRASCCCIGWAFATRFSSPRR